MKVHYHAVSARNQRRNTMPYLETVQEILEAKEGEHVQFKEAKNRFDFEEAAKCCCALANNGGGKLMEVDLRKTCV